MPLKPTTAHLRGGQCPAVRDWDEVTGISGHVGCNECLDLLAQ